jgi:hypothetical protein
MKVYKRCDGSGRIVMNDDEREGKGGVKEKNQKLAILPAKIRSAYLLNVKQE